MNRSYYHIYFTNKAQRQHAQKRGFGTPADGVPSRPLRRAGPSSQPSFPRFLGCLMHSSPPGHLNGGTTASSPQNSMVWKRQNYEALNKHSIFNFTSLRVDPRLYSTLFCLKSSLKYFQKIVAHVRKSDFTQELGFTSFLEEAEGPSPNTEPPSPQGDRS